MNLFTSQDNSKIGGTNRALFSQRAEKSYPFLRKLCDNGNKGFKSGRESAHMRVLVVEDEPGVARFIQQGLIEDGYAVDVARDGLEGLDFALTVDYDAIVLDIMLPKMSGLEMLREIRDQRVDSPVLLLTARQEVKDRVRGLDSGADDYLVKPFSFQELLARLRALLRRPPLQLGTVLRMDDLEMNTIHREVRRAGNIIDLSPREFSLLELLLRHPNQALTRTQILEHVWNYDTFSDSNVVDVYIGYLRRKVDRDYPTPLIHTIRGVGFRLSREGDDD
jgi:DNA-binding response OmpR family regulator